jgi:hypothetical protein
MPATDGGRDWTSDSLDYSLVNELEAPHTSPESLDVEQIKTWQVFDSAKFHVEFDLVTAVDAESLVWQL